MNRFDTYNKVKEKENDYIDLGDMHSDNGQHEEAIEYYNLALKVNPYNDYTYFRLCKSYLELNDPLNAEPYIKRAVEIDPGNPRYEYFNKKVSTIIAQEFGNKYQKRRDIVLNNIEKDQNMEEFEQQNYEKEIYEGEWITRKPEADSIDNAFKKNMQKSNDRQKAKIEEYYQDNNKKEALYKLSQQGYEDFSFKQSQELDYLDLGDLHFDNQEYETAIEYYKMAQSVNPNNDYTYYKISRSYIELGEYDSADKFIEKALALSEKNRKYVYFKNRISERLTGPKKTAEDEFYSPIEETEELSRQEIVKEPGEDFLYEQPSFLDRIKSAVTSIKLPDLPDFDFNIPEFSRITKRFSDPLEGKVEKFSETSMKKQEKFTKKEKDSIFNRPSDYYEIEEKNKEDFFAKKERDRHSFYEAEKKAEKSSGPKTPYNPDYYNRKGIEFFKTENYDQAEDYFKKAVQLKPMYAKGYNNLANIEAKRGNYEKAKEYALKSIEIDPEFPEGYYNLGLISKKQRNFRKEIHYLNKAISVEPKYYEAYFARGLAYYKKGSYPKAKYNFKQVLKYKNDHFLATQNLGIIYANELNYEEAENHLNYAVKLNRESSRAYFHLGVVRKNSGKLLSAIEDFQKAIELNPADYKSYIMLSKCYDMDSQPLKALNTLENAAEKHPENSEIYNYIGLLKLKFDKYKEASIAFRKAVEKNSKRPIYFYNLSQCYLTMDERKKSNYAFQRAVSIIPTSTQDYTDLAEIFFDRGMASYAIRVLKEGIEKLNNNDYLFLALSNFYERTGAIKAASQVLEDYLDKKGGESTFGLLIKRRLNKLESL